MGRLQKYLKLRSLSVFVLCCFIQLIVCTQLSQSFADESEDTGSSTDRGTVYQDSAVGKQVISSTDVATCDAKDVPRSRNPDDDVDYGESTTRNKVLKDLIWNLNSFWKNYVSLPRLPGEAYRRRLAPPPDDHHRVGVDFSLAASTQLAEEGNHRRVARSSSTSTSVEKGMILTISEDESYELVEPMYLELGQSLRYLEDYAYTPAWFGQPNVEDDRGSGIAKHDTVVEVETVGSRRDVWWQWWLPWWVWKGDINEEDLFSSDYSMNDAAFAGGSHGEVWRGLRRCTTSVSRRDTEGNHKTYQPACGQALIFKRLKIENGYRILEAGLREIHFGRFLTQQADRNAKMFTRYVDHFFREKNGVNGDGIDLWIVFEDAGPSLRSFLYEGIVVGDFIIYQHSEFWKKLRMSVSNSKKSQAFGENYDCSQDESEVTGDFDPENKDGRSSTQSSSDEEVNESSAMGRRLMGTVLRQIVEAAAFLHSNGIIHRDIKPSNVMCDTNLSMEDMLKDQLLFRDETNSITVHCVLGDFSSAWSDFTQNLYTRGPSRLEQTDEYAPPEAIFGYTYNQSRPALDPAFDSWSIGILALELLLGTPNVLTVDQRTRAVLSQKMQKDGASEGEIQRALYLAALSQFCIYNPHTQGWPLRAGLNPLHKQSTVKSSCTLNDFHRALRARDPLGLGFDSSADTLLHLIWQLLTWDPSDRMTAAEALKHPYFTRLDLFDHQESKDAKALESQMLDPRMDFNISDSVEEFRCPKCGRLFNDWNSCLQHANKRRHGKFCAYDRSSLPTCLNAHTLLPAHSYSGYCDIQGRRRSIEDFHAIHLLPNVQFYGIFDGHSGNLASKYVASFMFGKIEGRLSSLLILPLELDWRRQVEESLVEAFAEIHEEFLRATSLASHSHMDQSGTTATTAYVWEGGVVIASIGDSRAILSSWENSTTDGWNPNLSAVQLTKDHVASDPQEQSLVQSRGGTISQHNGVYRVAGKLAITRSIGDAKLSAFLSREPHVVAFTRDEIQEECGSLPTDDSVPCFLVVASDGLWDVLSNQEAVDLVAQVVRSQSRKSASQSASTSWRDTAALQQAAEALTLEAYVRGSRDNIGVAVIAIE